MSKLNQTSTGLDILIGEWTLQSPQYPEAQGLVSFEWLEGEAFAIQHSNPKSGEFPESVMVIGWDDTQVFYSVLYHDARGVSRVYQMSLDDHTWKMWRDAPGFAQRFTGELSQDGRTIQARWEKSFDNSHWEHDFDLVYTKVR